MNEKYMEFHVDVSEIAPKLNELLEEHVLVDYHILRDERTINKYFLVVGVSPKKKLSPMDNIVLL